jgi:hypothetical protein
MSKLKDKLVNTFETATDASCAAGRQLKKHYLATGLVTGVALGTAAILTWDETDLKDPNKDTVPLHAYFTVASLFSIVAPLVAYSVKNKKSQNDALELAAQQNKTNQNHLAPRVPE